MRSENFANRENLSSWLLSLMILLSVIGFSGPVSATSITQKQILTEDVQRVRVTQTAASFNRLRTELISKYFFQALAVQATRFTELRMKRAIDAAFQHASGISHSTITFEEKVSFRFRPRNLDDLFLTRA